MQQSPYNKTNVLITEANVRNILARYNIKITVNDITVYQKAFVEESYVKSTYSDENINKWLMNPDNQKCVPLQPESYELLEFLGDAIIKSVMTEYIVDRYYYETEGFCSDLRTSLENTVALANFSRKLNLGKYLIISKTIEDNNGRDSTKLLEDIFEAFIGALNKDQGYITVKNLLLGIFNSEIDYGKIIGMDSNYISRLQAFYSSNRWSYPEYYEIETLKIQGKNFHKICVLDHLKNKMLDTVATEQSKQAAKQESARLALIKFKVI